ncbi:MAG TPA: hypothetical protein VFA90_13910 [Terriglobales bacterium]|nr:hypothetical protein [Terriglobales bacterium]
MYTGNLIDDLIATVERAESSLRVEAQEQPNSEKWFAIASAGLLALEAAPQLAGVA